MLSPKQLRDFEGDVLRFRPFAAFDIAPGRLLTLEQLSLTGNGIELIGPGIASLSNLWNLVMEESRYKALPEEIEPLKPSIFPCEVEYD